MSSFPSLNHHDEAASARPRVSVIVPNYNHARYLRRRLDSILAQTFQNFDLILMDDCSTDQSRAILEEYAERTPRAKLLFNAQNSGSTFTQWNKGIAVATGEYIWMAESDDYADARLLERLVSLLVQHPKVGIAYCESFIVDADDHVLRTTHNHYKGSDHPDRWKSDFIASGAEECAGFMSQQNMIPNASAVVFRRELYNGVGGADETFRLNGDWKLWATMLLRCDLAHVAEPMNYFRTHKKNVRSSTRAWQTLQEAIRVVDFISRAVPVAPYILEHQKKAFADQWINAALWGKAAEKDARLQATQSLASFDAAYRRRIAARSAQRALQAALSGKAGQWISHVLSGKGR